MCSCENAVRSRVFGTVCTCVHCMFVLYWLLVVHGEMRVDQCREGRTEDNTQTSGMAKRIKETQMSHISIWDRRRDLFKPFQSSFLSDAGIQCFLPPLMNPKWSMYQILCSCQSLSLSCVSMWDRATLGDAFCSHLLLLCFLNPLLSLCFCFCPAEQLLWTISSSSWQPLERTQDVTTRRRWTRWRERTWRALPSTWASQVKHQSCPTVTVRVCEQKQH